MFQHEALSHSTLSKAFFSDHQIAIFYQPLTTKEEETQYMDKEKAGIQKVMLELRRKTFKCYNKPSSHNEQDTTI